MEISTGFSCRELKVVPENNELGNQGTKPVDFSHSVFYYLLGRRNC